MKPMLHRIVTAIAIASRRRDLPGLAVVALSLVLCPISGTVGAQQAPPSGRGAQDASALYQRGVALAQAGNLGQAIAEFEQALKLAPQDKVLLNATGAAYSMRGDLRTARNYFLKSLDSDPNFAPARQNLGITYFSLEDYSQAELQFKTLEAQHVSSEVIRLFLGMIAQKHGECSKGYELLRNTGALLYQYPQAILADAKCAYELGKPQEAVQVLAALDRIPTASAAERKEAADLYASLGRESQAISEHTKARTEFVAANDSDLKRARNLEDSGKLDEAQKLLQKVTSSSPTADGLMTLARVAKERGDLATALKSLKQVSELAPDREDSYLEFSTICADHGSDALALETAEIGLSHVPHSYGLTVQKGVVLEKLGRLSEAETTLKSAIEMAGDNSIAMLSLAVVDAHAGKIADAQQMLDEAIRRYPDNYYMQYFRGKLLLQFAGNTSGHDDLKSVAQQSLEAAIKLNPKYADSYYQLSTIYTENSPSLAEQALAKCLQLDPRHIPAQYALARLYVRTGRKAEGQALIAKLKTQQRAEELEQQKQLRIEIAQN